MMSSSAEMTDETQCGLSESYKELEIKYNSLVLASNAQNERCKQLQLENNTLQIHCKKLESALQLEPETNDIWDEAYDALQSKYEKSKQKKAKLKKALRDLEADYNILDIEIAEKTAKHQLLSNQHKALQIEYNNLKYNDSNYLTWKSEQVFEWMINIKQHFKQKYSDILNVGIKQERINGQDLQFLNKSDLHRLGITSFKDKNDIYMAINELITRLKRVRYFKYESAMRRKAKRVTLWNMNDIFKWLIDLNIGDKWYYNVINVIESNQIKMEDIISLNSAQEIAESFEIVNDEPLCNKLFAEIKRLQSNCAKLKFVESKYDSNASDDSHDMDTFEINIFSQGKLMVLHQKVSKEATVKWIKQIYKKQYGVSAKLKDIHFYSHLKLLRSHVCYISCHNFKYHVLTEKIKRCKYN